MEVRYKVKVIDCPDGLIIRSGPGTSFARNGKFSNNSETIVIERATQPNGSIWDKLESGKGWICHKGTRYYTKTIWDYNNPNGTTGKPSDQTGSKGEKPDPSGGVGGAGGGNLNPSSPHSPGGIYNIPDENKVQVVDQLEQLALASKVRGYPELIESKNGENVYDWSINVGDYDKSMDILRKNHNTENSIVGNTVMQKVFQNFNRFGIEFPDVHQTNTTGRVFITRPDINILDDSGKNLHQQVVNHDRIFAVYSENPAIVKSLNALYSKNHMFNPILCDRVESIEVSDEVVDTMETGETLIGHKVIYGKHNIKSISAGNVTIKYRDIRGLPVLKQHQVWVDYITGVYYGGLLPRKDRIFEKEIDYSCNAYYFLLDNDGETILFWSKYYGIFPTNVPKSVLSYDRDTRISFPEVSVNYTYFRKDDLSPVALIEFNEHSVGEFIYRQAYEPKLGMVGRTWVGPPFIQSFTKPDGTSGFKLRYRHN